MFQIAVIVLLLMLVTGASLAALVKGAFVWVFKVLLFMVPVFLFFLLPDSVQWVAFAAFVGLVALIFCWGAWANLAEAKQEEGRLTREFEEHRRHWKPDH